MARESLTTTNNLDPFLIQLLRMTLARIPSSVVPVSHTIEFLWEECKRISIQVGIVFTKNIGLRTHAALKLDFSKWHQYGERVRFLPADFITCLFIRSPLFLFLTRVLWYDTHWWLFFLVCVCSNKTAHLLMMETGIWGLMSSPGNPSQASWDPFRFHSHNCLILSSWDVEANHK